MSDNNDLQNIDEDKLPEGFRNRLKELQKQEAHWKDVEAENNRFRQQEALRSTGADLSQRQIKALLATHEGDTTPEALRKTAEELGFVKPVEDVNEEVQQGTQTIQRASQGAVSNPSTQFEDPYAGAKNSEEVLAIALQQGVPVSF